MSSEEYHSNVRELGDLLAVTTSHSNTDLSISINCSTYYKITKGSAIMKNLSLRNIKKHYASIGLAIVVIWLIVLTALFCIKEKRLNDIFDVEASNQITNNFALSNYKLPIIDIPENRVYIPESQSYLPLNDITRDLRYYIYSDSDIRFSTQKLIGAYSDTNESRKIACLEMVKLSSENNVVGTYNPVGELIEAVGDSNLKYILTQSDCAFHGASQHSASQIADEILKIQKY